MKGQVWTKARENPFASQYVERIRYVPDSAGMEIERLMDKLERMGWRAAITGPMGSGKTRLLEELQEHIEQRGMRTLSVFINDTMPLSAEREKQLTAKFESCDVVLLDGADELGALRWRRIKQKTKRMGVGLIVTAHKKGLLPILVECSPSKQTFVEIVNLLQDGREEFSAGELVRLYEQMGGNIRKCLRRLYDIRAERV